jgi:hypothetical protein
LGGIKTVNVSEVDHLVTDFQVVGALRTRVPRDEWLAVVKDDLDQVSKEFSHFPDMIGNKP